MTDLTQTIIAKSDQLNSDDLIGREITIKVSKVSLAAGDQPVAINYEGDGGKPFFPCKSMRRVLVNCWGPDGNAYVGRSMTLYRDDTVTFGGQAVGGIRISHLSDIKSNVTVSLTATKKSKKPFTVKPLEATKPEKSEPTAEQKNAAAKKKADSIIAEIDKAADVQTVMEKHKDMIARFKEAYPDLYEMVTLAADAKLAEADEDELPL
jgi:hypothetical protein